MRLLFVCLLCCLFLPLQAQEENLGLSLSLKEYLGYVKRYHPVARQAELRIDKAQAKLMKSRGAFDPKVYGNYKEKDFEGSDYYEILNAGFSIPVWFGLDINAGFEQNEGEYLNPERNVPDNGLYKAGVSLPIGRGLFINDRMATLKQAKIFQNLNQVERDLRVNQILYDAVLAYIDWYLAQQEVALFDEFVENAKIRFDGIKKSAQAGDIPSIDTLEAKIIVQNRELSLEQSELKLTQKRLQLSNYLWYENNTPLEVQSEMQAEKIETDDVDDILGTNLLQLEDYNTENHPAIKALSYSINSLEVERKLAAEQLKPTLDLQYNLLSREPNEFEQFNTNNYKAGISFSMPLFLRKERGDLKLTKLKIQDAEMEYDFQSLELENRIKSAQQEINSFIKQLNTVSEIAENYSDLLTAEERKFFVGESSVFLINAREQQLIDAKLKRIKARAKLFESKADLFNLLANDIIVENE
ncbi:MAG: TolC family protein [Bacteroidota bacterium]